MAILAIPQPSPIQTQSSRPAIFRHVLANGIASGW